MQLQKVFTKTPRKIISSFRAFFALETSRIVHFLRFFLFVAQRTRISLGVLGHLNAALVVGLERAHRLAALADDRSDRRRRD